MATAKQDAVWVSLDIETLDTECRKTYDEYKASYRGMKGAREAFESKMNYKADLAHGMRMIFGYNFGKLSVAVVEDDRKAPKAKATTQSLSDFLAQAQSSGRRT